MGAGGVCGGRGGGTCCCSNVSVGATTREGEVRGCAIQEGCTNGAPDG